VLGITESVDELCCGDLSSKGVSKPGSLVTGGIGEEPVDPYSCAKRRPKSGMNGESDLEVGYNNDASASLLPWLCPYSSDGPSAKMQLALLARLRTPYVLSSTAWCRGGDGDVFILFISSSVRRENDVGALIRAVRPGEV